MATPAHCCSKYILAKFDESVFDSGWFKSLMAETFRPE